MASGAAPRLIPLQLRHHNPRVPTTRKPRACLPGSEQNLLPKPGMEAGRRQEGRVGSITHKPAACGARPGVLSLVQADPQPRGPGSAHWIWGVTVEPASRARSSPWPLHRHCDGD